MVTSFHENVDEAISRVDEHFKTRKVRKIATLSLAVDNVGQGTIVESELKSRVGDLNMSVQRISQTLQFIDEFSQERELSYFRTS